ncbi:MAG: LysM peptidoglycan-binding domain-containing protein [Pedosphaera sp.]|nr:LysM peptidoglycan-binding domain-containing protein [Pedosphaera sp.]
MTPHTPRFFLCLMILLTGLGFGCDSNRSEGSGKGELSDSSFPWISAKSDPKKEANYQQADAYQRIRQFDKAIEYYQRALIVNPRNADAHLGLGLIYSDSTKQPEYGYAYYHLSRYIEMAHATNDLIPKMIHSTGLALAEQYAAEIGKIETQGDLYKLRKENSDLHKALGTLTNQIVVLTVQLESVRSSMRAVGGGGPPSPVGPAGVVAEVPQKAPPVTRSVPSSERTVSPTASVAGSKYRVQARDTLASIARKNGVTLQKLQAANPNIDSRRLKLGQELRVP